MCNTAESKWKWQQQQNIYCVCILIWAENQKINIFSNVLHMGQTLNWILQLLHTRCIALGFTDFDCMALCKVPAALVLYTSVGLRFEYLHDAHTCICYLANWAMCSRRRAFFCCRKWFNDSRLSPKNIGKMFRLWLCVYNMQSYKISVEIYQTNWHL